MNQLDFAGRKALITGGSQGIGRAVAERLLCSGADVYIWGLNEDRITRAHSELCTMSSANSLHRNVYGKRVDIRDEGQVRQGVDDALLILGHVDVLINNAGAFGPMKSALAYSLAEWEEGMRVNLTSQFLVCRELVPHMVDRGYGRIVNMASVVGRDANPMAPVYSTAKAGVIRFTQALGRELAKTGVLVNCVAPSAIKTAFFDTVPPEQITNMVAKVPMGRIGGVDDVVELICWLASSGCTYSAGAVFDCSGGRHD